MTERRSITVPNAVRSPFKKVPKTKTKTKTKLSTYVSLFSYVSRWSSFQGKTAAIVT